MRGILGEIGSEGEAITVIDLEAGLEHLKRGTPRHTDVMLVVAEPYYRSLHTAAGTATMAGDLGIPRVGIVANKVRDERDEEAVRKVFSEAGHVVLGTVPYDEAVIEADRRPGALIDVAPESTAVRAVSEIAGSVLDGEARR